MVPQFYPELKCFPPATVLPVRRNDIIILTVSSTAVSGQISDERITRSTAHNKGVGTFWHFLRRQAESACDFHIRCLSFESVEKWSRGLNVNETKSTGRSHFSHFIHITAGDLITAGRSVLFKEHLRSSGKESRVRYSEYWWPRIPPTFKNKVNIRTSFWFYFSFCKL